jgi:acetylornithine deacetylase
MEQDARDLDYDIPYSTIHVGKIEGGTALNIVPSHCTFDFEIRNLAEDDASALLSEINAIAGSARKRFPEAKIAIELTYEYSGLRTPPESDAVQFVKAITGETSTTKVVFGSEGGLFARDAGIPAVVWGPGSIDQAHKPDEFITLEQLHACDRIMDRLLDRLCLRAGLCHSHQLETA